MEVGKLSGMFLRIHPSLPVVLVVYGALGFLAQALLIFVLVLGHEVAHLLAARAYGFKILGIELFPFGGTAYSDGAFEGRKVEESTVALAGPLFNLALLFGAEVLRLQGWWEGAGVENFIRYNFWLAAFNLIPALPLDGGRIARAMLAGTFGFVRTTKALAWMGKLLGILSAVSGFVLWGSGRFGEGTLFLFMLSGFFWIAGNKEISTARIVFLRQLTKKKEELALRGLMPSKTITVQGETPLVRIVERFTPDYYALITLTGQSFKVAKTLTETEVLEGMFREGIYHQVGKL